jgi:alpha/beta superfamily hydrolase
MSMAIRLSPLARLVHFPSADGLRLEGRCTPGEPERTAVLCHPHPLYGGSMLTPVIMTVEQAFQKAGFTTLAFNFRGVGGSQGEYDEGRAETADVAGALSYHEESLGHPPRVRVVAGYSFGSAVGGRVAARDPRVSGYLGVAPPLVHDDFAFLRAARCPVALIGAGRDEFCPRPAFDTLLASLEGPHWARVIEADHAFAGAARALLEACGEAGRWLEGAGPL